MTSLWLMTLLLVGSLGVPGALAFVVFWDTLGPEPDVEPVTERRSAPTPCSSIADWHVLSY